MRRISCGLTENRLNEFQNQHTAPITSVEWSPDGQLLATGSYDGSVKVWDSQEMIVLKTFLHVRLVNSVRWSPDGRFIASGSADKTCRIWDYKTGACVEIFARHCDDVNSMAWSADGKIVFTISEDGTGRYWNVKNSEMIGILLAHSNHCMGVDWNHQHSILATCGEDATIRYWNASRNMIAEISQPGDLETCRWSPDGKLLAAAVDDGWVRLFNVNGDLIMELGPHTAPVKSVTWSPASKKIASGTYASECHIWDIEYGKNIASYKENRLWPRSLHWNPKQNAIALGTFDGSPKILELKENTNNSLILKESIYPDAKPTFGINALTTVKNTIYIAQDDGQIRVWNPSKKSLNVVLKTKINNSLVNTISWNHKYNLFAWGSFSGEVGIHGIDDSINPNLRLSTTLGVPINQVSWSPSCELLAVADYDGRFTLFRLENLNLKNIGQYIIHNGAMKSLDWLNNNELVTGGTDRLVKIISVHGDELRNLEGHSELVNSISITRSTHEIYIASASRDRTVRVWNAKTGDCVHVLLGHDESVKSVVWKPGSNQLLASGSYDYDVRLWNINTNILETDQSLVFPGHRNGVGALTWIGNYLISASWDCTLRKWPRVIDEADWHRLKKLESKKIILPTQTLHINL